MRLETLNIWFDLADSPSPSPSNYRVPDREMVEVPPALFTGVKRLIGFCTWITFALAVAGVVFCGMRVAIAYKEGGQVLVPGLISPMVACIIAASASAVIGIFVF
ncbi:hypothetical protein OG216_46235 (plasmid) [Streptomycetaceae bacterium NBC_01309]